MKIFRGENNQVEGFSIFKGDSALLSEHGPGKYFFNFTHRNRALVYALDSSTNLFNDDTEVVLDKGYFYECSIDQDEARTLDKISASEVSGLMEVVNHVMDSCEFDLYFLDAIEGKTEEEKFDNFISGLQDMDSVYSLIVEMHKTMKPSCNSEFCSAISEMLNDLGSWVAFPPDGKGEVIVYEPSRISILKVIEVNNADLQRTREERMALAREVR